MGGGWKKEQKVGCLWCGYGCKEIENRNRSKVERDEHIDFVFLQVVVFLFLLSFDSSSSSSFLLLEALVPVDHSPPSVLSHLPKIFFFVPSTRGARSRRPFPSLCTLTPPKNFSLQFNPPLPCLFFSFLSVSLAVVGQYVYQQISRVSHPSLPPSRPMAA